MCVSIVYLVPMFSLLLSAYAFEHLFEVYFWHVSSYFDVYLSVVEHMYLERSLTRWASHCMSCANRWWWHMTIYATNDHPCDTQQATWHTKGNATHNKQRQVIWYRTSNATQAKLSDTQAMRHKQNEATHTLCDKRQATRHTSYATKDKQFDTRRRAFRRKASNVT